MILIRLFRNIGSEAYICTAKFCPKVVFAPKPKLIVAQFNRAAINPKIRKKMPPT